MTAIARSHLARRFPLGVLFALALAVLPGGAFAQAVAPAPSQVTPQNIAPPANAPPPSLNITGTAAKAPPGAENIHVTIAAVAIADGYPDMAAISEQLSAPYRGQIRSVAQLYGLAGDIEGAYAAAGYVLARVVVPPQSLNDGGTLQLKVIDGYIESLDLSHVPAEVAGPVGERLQRLVGLKRPRLPQIERALTLAAAVPGVTLRSTMVPGKAEGGTQLIIEAEYKPIAGSLSADNHLGPLFDDWEANLQLSENSMLGLGEVAYIYLSGNPNLAIAFNDNAPRRVGGAGFTLPLGDDGLAATLEGTMADTKPFVPSAFFQTNGLFKRLDGRLSYPILKSRAESLTLGGTFEYSVQTEVASAFGVVLDEDRLNVLRLSLDWTRAFPWLANLELYGQVSKGVTWLNVRTVADVAATDAGFSRAGATPNFEKAEARLVYSQSGLPYGVSVAVQLRGQTGLNNVMPSSELFSLDGDDAVSPLTSGSVSGDNGVVSRLEVQRPVQWAGVTVTPYLFGSVGRIFDKNETPSEILYAVGYGAGFHASFPGVKGVFPSLSVEAGHENAGALSANRVMVSLGVSF